ncbi:hypothetical protein [Alteromonas gilva]|uniref:HEAT repeat domain-containing protein n=1 Tax=Alteromonas gilva TaxID=2987522 RepID=A0ABT5KZ09_9ALTE|nr:hypothetical protein [Alteromonas gilva]MDC8830007.1 hypothetical protein [Alteromonas gilva]
MKLRIGALWLLSLIGAYWFGATQVDSDLDSAPDLSAPTSQHTNVPKDQQTAGVAGGGAGAEEPLLTRVDALQQESSEADQPATVLSVDDVVNKTRQLLQGTGFASSMAKIVEAYQLVELLDVAQVTDALDMLGTGSSSGEMQITQLYLSRLAELAPMQAMDYVIQQFEGGRSKIMAASTVLAVWAEKAPQAALDWYINQPSETLSDELGSPVLYGLFASIARQDLNQAMNNLTTSLDSDNFKEIDMAIRGTVSALDSTEDFELMLEKVQVLDNDQALEIVMSNWIDKDPYAALAKIESLGDDARAKELEQNVFRNWMFKDPDTAVETYMQRAEPGERQGRAKLVAQTLSATNPQKAIDWLQKQSDINPDGLFSDVLERASFRNPQFAEDNLQLVTEPDNLKSLASNIYRSYGRYSQTKADAFLARQPPKLREQVLEHFKKIEEYRKNNQ